jgi:hypothetical protein
MRHVPRWNSRQAAELMVQVAPSMYRKYVINNAKGKPVLYVQLEKMVYSMMKSALLFYRKLVADLTSLGYEMCRK